MKSTQSNYHSYLLRLWRENGPERMIWRASLEDVQTGELRGFENLAALLRYLEEQAFVHSEDAAVLGL